VKFAYLGYAPHLSSLALIVCSSKLPTLIPKALRNSPKSWHYTITTTLENNKRSKRKRQYLRVKFDSVSFQKPQNILHISMSMLSKELCKGGDGASHSHDKSKILLKTSLSEMFSDSRDEGVVKILNGDGVSSYFPELPYWKVSR